MVFNCQNCNKSIEPKRTRIYCGSLKDKTGCAYQIRLEKQRKLMAERNDKKRTSAKIFKLIMPTATEPEYKPNKVEYWFTQSA